MSIVFAIELGGGRFLKLVDNVDRVVPGWCYKASDALLFVKEHEATLFARSESPSDDWRVVPVAYTRPVVTDEERFPRRLDWPLVSTIEGLSDAIFAAHERSVGVRIPVLMPGAAKLPFEPPVRLCVYFGTDVLKGNLVRRSVLNVTSHALGFKLGAAEALFCRAYFPAGVQPVSEWHVEYSIELRDVPMELIPESFSDREAA